uniref:Actin binding Rho activating protein b n=1 Tax=Salmo trutta TaxID=8032 RepID=A0A674DD92_SALTR
MSLTSPLVPVNHRKLLPICMVSNLTRSWQKWVSEIKDKLAKEPISLAPHPLRELWDEPPKTPSITKLGTWQKKVCPCQDPTADPSSASIRESRIKTKQVVKTVTSGVQERSVGTTFLTEIICMEAPSPGEEIDRTLSKRGSLALHRKCSKVSKLTLSWKQEKERNTDSTGSSGEAMQRDSDGISPKGKVESWVRVKRPSSSVSKKELDDANKINALSKKYSAVGNLKSRWQNWSSTNTVNQKLNPFSEDFDYEYSMSLRLHKAKRARRAEQHIHGEIADMCYVIRTMNDPDPDWKTRVTFRELFDRYLRVSDKVVGILLRAKRHGKVAFEEEMLWQGQDNGVIITLLV